MSVPIKTFEIIYTLIARDQKVVLCDFSEYNGNAPVLSLQVLERITKNKRCEIEHYG